MASVTGALKGLCPKCNQGKIFATQGAIFKFQVPKMHEKCPCCGYKFEKEPGYFLGAMYVSYGLTILEMLPTFLILVWFISLNWIFLILFLMLVFTMFFNFRFSRIVWIHLFTY